jgi:hypothetical protein
MFGEEPVKLHPSLVAAKGGAARSSFHASDFCLEAILGLVFVLKWGIENVRAHGQYFDFSFALSHGGPTDIVDPEI